MPISGQRVVCYNDVYHVKLPAVSFNMYVKQIVFLTAFITVVKGIYPYFDTQDFIYNIPKVYRISITLDKLLEYYEKKPSKDPEWFIALGVARGNVIM